jgi:hypothetical protein
MDLPGSQSILHLAIEKIFRRASDEAGDFTRNGDFPRNGDFTQKMNSPNEAGHHPFTQKGDFPNLIVI